MGYEGIDITRKPHRDLGLWGIPWDAARHFCPCYGPEMKGYKIRLFLGHPSRDAACKHQLLSLLMAYLYTFYGLETLLFMGYYT